jgi:hypothetical protein
MIQVRFDDESRSRLVLIWEETGVPRAPENDARAANLLFSVIGRGEDAEAAAPSQPRRARPARSRRRAVRAEASKPH